MAIYAPSPAIGAISGDLGSISFSNPSGSKVVRKKRRSTKSPNSVNIEQQARLARAAKAWASLTSSQRKAWNTAAALSPRSNRIGISRNRSGYQYFMRVALLQLLIGGSIPSLPSLNQSGPLPRNIQFDITLPTDIEVTFSAPGTGITVEAMIYARPLFRNTPQTFNNSWTFVSHEKAVNPLFFNFKVEYLTKFSILPQSGQFVAFRYDVLNLSALATPSITQIIQA